MLNQPAPHKSSNLPLFDKGPSQVNPSFTAFKVAPPPSTQIPPPHRLRPVVPSVRSRQHHAIPVDFSVDQGHHGRRVVGMDG